MSIDGNHVEESPLNRYQLSTVSNENSMMHATNSKKDDFSTSNIDHTGSSLEKIESKHIERATMSNIPNKSSVIRDKKTLLKEAIQTFQLEEDNANKMKISAEAHTPLLQRNYANISASTPDNNFNLNELHKPRPSFLEKVKNKPSLAILLDDSSDSEEEAQLSIQPKKEINPMKLHFSPLPPLKTIQPPRMPHLTPLPSLDLIMPSHVKKSLHEKPFILTPDKKGTFDSKKTNIASQGSQARDLKTSVKNSQAHIKELNDFISTGSHERELKHFAKTPCDKNVIDTPKRSTNKSSTSIKGKQLVLKLKPKSPLPKLSNPAKYFQDENYEFNFSNSENKELNCKANSEKNIPTFKQLDSHGFNRQDSDFSMFHPTAQSSPAVRSINPIFEAEYDPSQPTLSDSSIDQCASAQIVNIEDFIKKDALYEKSRSLDSDSFIDHNGKDLLMAQNLLHPETSKSYINSKNQVHPASSKSKKSSKYKKKRKHRHKEHKNSKKNRRKSSESEFSNSDSSSSFESYTLQHKKYKKNKYDIKKEEYYRKNDKYYGHYGENEKAKLKHKTGNSYKSKNETDKSRHVSSSSGERMSKTNSSNKLENMSEIHIHSSSSHGSKLKANAQRIKLKKESKEKSPNLHKHKNEEEFNSGKESGEVSSSNSSDSNDYAAYIQKYYKRKEIMKKEKIYKTKKYKGLSSDSDSNNTEDSSSDSDSSSSENSFYKNTEEQKLNKEDNTAVANSHVEPDNVNNLESKTSYDNKQRELEQEVPPITNINILSPEDKVMLNSSSNLDPRIRNFTEHDDNTQSMQKPKRKGPHTPDYPDERSPEEMDFSFSKISPKSNYSDTTILKESPVRGNLDLRLKDMFGIKDTSSEESPAKAKAYVKPFGQHKPVNPMTTIDKKPYKSISRFPETSYTPTTDKANLLRPLRRPPSPFISRNTYLHWFKETYRFKKSFNYNSHEYVDPKSKLKIGIQIKEFNDDIIDQEVEYYEKNATTISKKYSTFEDLDISPPRGDRTSINVFDYEDILPKKPVHIPSKIVMEPNSELELNIGSYVEKQGGNKIEVQENGNKEKSELIDKVNIENNINMNVDKEISHQVMPLLVNNEKISTQASQAVFSNNEEISKQSIECESKIKDDQTKLESAGITTLNQPNQIMELVLQRLINEVKDSLKRQLEHDSIEENLESFNVKRLHMDET